MNPTTLKISHKLKNVLEKEKNYPRESLEDVIARIWKAAHENDNLSVQTIKNIEEGVADIKAGRVYTTEQLNKELGL